MSWRPRQWYEWSFRRMLTGFTGTHLLSTGIRLELFKALREPRTANQLAREYRLAPDLLQAWLRAAEAHDLIRAVRDKEGAYEVCGLARWMLESEQTESLVAIVDSVIENCGPVFERMPDLLRGADRPDFAGSKNAKRAAQAVRLIEPGAIEAMGRIPGVRRARRVLDVGCGHATYLSRFLLRYRDAHGLGIERDPEVAASAIRNLKAADLERRGEIQVGDFMTVEIAPGSFDLVLINNSLHYFAPSLREALFDRARSRLVDGGHIAIQIPVVSTQATSRATGLTASTATFDLFLRSHNDLYGLPDVEEVHSMLSSIGFGTIGQSVFRGGAARYIWGKKTG